MWEWYRELFTGTRLSYQELHYWAQMRAIPVAGWEVDLIRSLDRIFWEVHNGG